MKVFISWSGSRSRAVAELLSDWIKCVIQATRPWISTRDIDRGSLWFSEISDQLKDTSVGIVCITQENKKQPWILFEAGALAKGLSSNRVCTFLIDLKPSDIEDPLAQFNHTLPDKESVRGLIRTLNNCLGAAALDERILDQVFNTYWGQFDEKFKNAIKLHSVSEKPEVRSEKNLLAEILDNTRFLSHRIRNLEQRIERDPFIGVPENLPLIHSPDSNLNSRQSIILELIAAGYSNMEIAEKLGLSENTVKIHVANIFRQLQVGSRAELISKYARDLSS